MDFQLENEKDIFKQETETENKIYRNVSGFLGIIGKIFLGLIPISASLFILHIPDYLGLIFWKEQYLGIFLLFTFVAIFIYVPAFPIGNNKENKHVPWYDILLIFLSVIVAGYVIVYYPVVGLKVGVIAIERAILGVVTMLLLLEAVRRLLGWPLVILTAVMVLYAFTCSYLPGPLHGVCPPWERLMTYLYLDPNGLLGITLDVSATIVVAFIFLGSLMFEVGGDKFLLNSTLALLGKLKGGMLKAAILASALFGTISGVAVANVVATGVITIPLMKRSGVSPEFAAATEATASTGGTIAPPVMGVVAFIMADLLGLPYSRICFMAIIPALLYYYGVYLTAQLQVERFNIGDASKLKGITIPPLKQTLREGWIFIIPLAILIYILLVVERPPEQGAIVAVFSIMLIGFLKKQLSWSKLWQNMMNTGRQSLQIGVIGAIAGYIIGIIFFTGLGYSFSLWVVRLSGESSFLMLTVAAIASIIMGMGMPIVTVYLILVVLLAPALEMVGIIPAASHMFMFYFAMVSFITPPVCLSVYAAASIARSQLIPTAMHALKMGLAAYIVPFMFVYYPAILLIGTWQEIVSVCIVAVCSISLLVIGFAGYLFRNIGFLRRALFTAAGFLILINDAKIRCLGIIIALIVFLVELYFVFKERMKKKEKVAI